MNPPNKQNLASTALLLLTLCMLTVAVYWPGLSGDYMFDDLPNLLDNQRLDITSLDFESLYTAAMSSDSGELRRPVSMLSFALNRYFFGLPPYSHKLVNLGIHLLTGIALFLLARLIIHSYQQFRETTLPDTVMFWLPLVVVGLWLVHPLNLTSVLYIVQRMTSLSTFFMVCGLCFYVAGRARMLTGRKGLLHLLVGLFGFGSLALFSKESGALLPLYMFILELTLFRFRNSQGRLDRTTCTFFGIVLLLPGLLVLGWLAMHPDYILNRYNTRPFTLPERLMTEARVLVFYLKMIVMPSVSELGLFHDDIAISKGLYSPPATLYAIIFLAGLITAAFVLLKKHALLSLGILWFFCGHMLESTVIALELVHEHRNYLADFGILLALASLGTRVPSRKLRPLVQAAFPALFLVMFSITTWVRAGQWSDNINQAIYDARHHPQSLRSVYSAGRIQARLALEDVPGAYEKSNNYLAQASALDDSDIMASIVMIKLAYLTGNPVDQAWIDRVLERLPKHPVTPTTLNSLHELVSCMNGSCTLEHGIMDEMFRRVLANDSLQYNSGLHAETYSVYGYFTINVRGDFDKGRELFYRAVEIGPQEAQRHINLVNLLTVMGRYDEAEQQLKLFMETETHGSSLSDYESLQSKIDAARHNRETETPKDPIENG